MVNRKKYRYILTGIVKGTDKISDFRLVSANNVKPYYHGSSALKVSIPSDLELTKYSCDSYSTTTDSRTLDELGYDVLIWNNVDKKWEVHNEFKHLNPHEFPNLPKELVELTHKVSVIKNHSKVLKFIKENIKYYDYVRSTRSLENGMYVKITDITELQDISDDVLIESLDVVHHIY